MRKSVLAALAAFAAAAAFGGDASAEALQRLLNSRASGSPRDYAAAAELVASDAEQGRPLQQFVLALVAGEPNAPAAARMSAEKRASYLDQSRGKIQALAEQKGNALAWYLLSLEKNDLTMLKRAADGGNVQALNSWGTITLTQAFSNPAVDTNDMVRIVRRSYNYFKQAADQGDPNGVYNLGMCYLHGYGVERDLDKAYASFRTAAEAGHPEAINNIGGFYRDGIVVERDLVLAARQFKRSAEMQNPYGELNYALALQRGEGVEKDVKAAAGMFRHAAEQGNAEAMNAYAMCLFGGAGVEKDEAAAVFWYRRSAAAGFPPAMDNLATCSAQGAGGLRKSDDDATVWKVRANAARGDRQAAAWLTQNGHKLREAD